MINLSNKDQNKKPDLQSALLGKLGTLEVRLARSKAELASAQELRYQIFYEEMSAINPLGTTHLKRDQDRFDAYCDHIVVVETSEGGTSDSI